MLYIYVFILLKIIDLLEINNQLPKDEYYGRIICLSMIILSLLGKYERIRITFFNNKRKV